MQREAFDAVLMDLHMPVMDGFEATQRIRQLPQGRTLPIIAMTAAVLAQDRQRSAEAGMNDFVAKPIDPNELVATLLRHCALTPPLAPSFSGLVPEVPVVDFNLDFALARMDNDRALYARLVLSF